MALVLLGEKLGMTRVFTDKGMSTPVTVLRVGPCVVTQVKTAECDGYDAVQIGFGDLKPSRAKRPVAAHDFKAGTAPKRTHCEFRLDESEIGSYELGQELGVDVLEKFAYLDIAGTSKGKGFQGVMKRHHFSGLEASHGVERKHRSGGSIGGGGTNLGTGPKLKKGKKMAGHMGDERVTIRSLDVVRIVPEDGLLLVKGPVPGPNKGIVEIREPSRLYRSKARRQIEKAAG